MSRSSLVLLLICAAGFGLASPAQATTMSYLDNGVVKVGVDLDRGGMIVYLAPSGADPAANLVDASTLADGIQPWFKAGNGPFKSPAPPFENNPWNPSVGGDVYGHPSYISPRWDFSNDGTTIHTRTWPQQWALNDQSCRCQIEQWVTLDVSAVHVRTLLSMWDWEDSFGSGLLDQELPALHLSSKLSRVFAYTGATPYAGGSLTELAAGSTRADVIGSENWAALVDASGSGIGVIHPGITRYEYADGFLAPVAVANLAKGTTYRDESTIVLGNVAQIRAYAAAHRPDARPDYKFTSSDDRHWVRWNAVPPDAAGVGFGTIPGDDPQLLGPDEWFQAADVSTLYIRGAWHTHDTLAQLYWRAPGTAFSERQSVRFRVIDDGLMHTYAVPLSGNSLYTGTVVQLRLDPVCCAEGPSLVDLASISWRPDPTAITVAIEHPRQIVLRLVRDKKHRLGALGWLTAPDAYLPCVVHVPIRLQRFVGGSWVQAKTLYTGRYGEFSVALPPKSHSHYRAVAGLLTLKGNVCSAITAAA